ncbi:cyclic nucleotide-binding domain-containing protein [Paraburkholderia dinghuensis]|uniref:Crp/Fnr family transcriptional regulator n=1 Tax=Paraburkholderia dinghuensis TaxID=2305225 RepID=A0A3N6MCF5_9BURK|nr:cyclic nucleotide-binding domain-containing protein [Paraburkholderia dinghuensis]RQH01574.1 Crp/Fnr family transcriptional regulator [Paraburkholderia dinghuensis]
MSQLASPNSIDDGSPARRSDIARCSICAMQTLCVPRNVDKATLGSLEKLIQSARSLRRGQYVYSSDHEARYLFAVRSGAVKTMARTRDGREQIVGVHRPGDALGLDGLATGTYAFDAVALHDTTVCLIPYNQFRQMCNEMPAVQQRLFEIMGRQLVQVANGRLSACMQSVEARVVGFFIELAENNAMRGFSSREFTMYMTRAEVGNYLGTTLETVCRVISALSRDGIIEAHGKRIRVLDPDRLKARLVSHATKPEQVTADAVRDEESTLVDEVCESV